MTRVATIYTGVGAVQPLVVAMPGTESPTGVVFNPTASDFGGALFLFATLSGTIAAWSSGSSASLEATGGSPAAYTGLTLGASGGSNFLYAANPAGLRIDVYDSSFAPITLGSGTFVDPTLPAGYFPFNVRNIGGTLYVTYRTSTNGAGLGIVDEYDTNGVFQKRLITGGALNSPWGIALAPSGFGDLGGDLLVGNFGDGRINAFNPSTGAFISTLNDSGGNAIVLDTPWSLLFGNGGNGGGENELFFSAGIDNQTHGLFGKFVPNLPDLTVAKSHAQGFVQGGVATYSIVVTNSGNAPSSGEVTVTDALPAGLTPVLIEGSGWSCSLGSLTCTRSDTLAAGASYPPIQLTVAAAPNAPASVTNTVTVSGGGESNTANDTATDPTSIAPSTTAGVTVPTLSGPALGLLALLLAAGALVSLRR